LIILDHKILYKYDSEGEHTYGIVKL